MASPKTARIPLPGPPYHEQAAVDLKTTFGDQEPFALFKAMATSERSWAKFRGGSLLDGRLISMREREIIIDRTCARTRCEWEWGVHVMAFAEKAGLGGEEVGETLRVPPDLSKWSKNEAALIQAVDAFHERNTLSDAEFADLANHYNTDQISR